MNYLSSRQQVIVDQIDSTPIMHITGGAGTGKTVIAMMIAKHFGQQDKKVLYICFNRNLAVSLRFMMQSWKNIQITNYDALGTIRLPKYNNQQIRNKLQWPENGDRSNWTQTDWEKERQRIKDSLFNCTDMHNFDILIIDEAQDLYNEYIASLFCLKTYQGKIFIFSDPNQSLFIEDWKLNVNNLFPGITIPVEELTENWRNTKQIHTHYNDILPDNCKPRIKGEKGVRAIRSDEVESFLRGLLKEGRRPKDIALLSIGGAAIAVENVTADRHTYNLNDNISSWYENRSILKTSVEGFKGLEASIVVLFGDEELPAIFPKTVRDQRTKDRYVGESRAQYELYIVQQ